MRAVAGEAPAMTERQRDLWRRACSRLERPPGDLRPVQERLDALLASA